MLEPILVMRGQKGGPPMPGNGDIASPFANAYAPAEIAKKAMTQRDQANQLGQGFGAGGGTRARRN